MKYHVIGAAALGALVAMAPAAFSQRSGGEAGVQAAPGAAGGSGAAPSPGSSPSAQPRSGGAEPQQRSGAPERAQGRDAAARSRGAGAGENRPERGDRSPGASERREAGQGQRERAAEGRSDKGDRGAKQRREAQQDETREKRRETREQRREDRDEKGEGQRRAGDAADREQRRSEASDRARGDKRQRSADERRDSAGDQGKRQQVRLDGERRKRVETAFREHRKRDHVTNIEFEVNIGRRVPRRVRLYPIPAAIVSIVPAYRTYRYVIVDDRYVIIDPETYEIVYVLDGSDDAGLTLAATERDVILSRIDFGRPARSFSFRLGIGATVPADIELSSFPEPVVERVPRLKGYRFVVVERSVVIVDPADREIALVLDR